MLAKGAAPCIGPLVLTPWRNRDHQGHQRLRPHRPTFNGAARARSRTSPDIEIVINDLLEPDYLAYMLQYDSVHGRFKGTVGRRQHPDRQRQEDPPDRR